MYASSNCQGANVPLAPRWVSRKVRTWMKLWSSCGAIVRASRGSREALLANHTKSSNTQAQNTVIVSIDSYSSRSQLTRNKHMNPDRPYQDAPITSLHVPKAQTLIPYKTPSAGLKDKSQPHPSSPPPTTSSAPSPPPHSTHASSPAPAAPLAQIAVRSGTTNS